MFLVGHILMSWKIDETENGHQYIKVICSKRKVCCGPTLRARGRAGALPRAEGDSAPKAGFYLWLFPANSLARR
jgi:hypothetical protein